MTKYYLIFIFSIPLLCLSQAGSESSIETVDADITFLGQDETSASAGKVEYKIYYDNVDGILDKPIFVLDGFDPGDSRGIDVLFDAFNNSGTTQNIVTELRNEGFDIIEVNFPTYTSITDNTTVIDGGADFIQRNAFAVIALLEDINAQTVTTNDNVVIGTSMGGLIARYALAYMEQNSIPHETRLYISFDAPHKGANVAIGLQYLFAYFVNSFGLTDLQSILDGFNSAAAKQMLIDHYSAHVDTDGFTQVGSLLPLGAPNFRDAWQTELDNIGFPQSTRNIAVVNGSGIGTTSGNPGDNIINHTFNLGLATAAVNLNFTPEVSQTNSVTNVIVSGLINDTYNANAESPSFTDGVDSAPGGTTDLSTLDDGSNALLTEFVTNLNQSTYCFIPTISALSIDTDDWYALPSVTTRSSTTTPFANTFIPDNNEAHVELTDANVAFMLQEILNTTLSNPTVISKGFSIAQNPIREHLIIRSDRTQNATVQLIDVTGKIVFNTNTQLDTRTEIPMPIDSGFYILNILGSDNSKFTTKVF